MPSKDPREAPWTLMPGVDASAHPCSITVQVGGTRVHCIAAGQSHWWVGEDRCSRCGGNGLQCQEPATLHCPGCASTAEPLSEGLQSLSWMMVDQELYVLLEHA